jgi:hypothetical protein
MKIYIMINQKVLFGILDVHIFFYKLGQTLQTFERTYMHYILARREYILDLAQNFDMATIMTYLIRHERQTNILNILKVLT